MFILEQKLVVKPGSMSYEMWEELPIPMYTKIYFFNCTNSEDVMLQGAKPLLKQVGPYVFREEHKKTNISFNKNYTVNFLQKKFWHWEPDMSQGSMDDEIFTVNMIAVAASAATYWPDAFVPDDYPFMRFMMDHSLKDFGEELFVKVRVGNLTFEGIDSPLLHMGDDAGPLKPAIEGNIPFDKFGWFYGRNGSETYDGQFQMFTGEDDIGKVGQISLWNGRDNVGHLFPAPCDRLEGSAGEFFPMNQSPTSISYFTTDLCRPIHFNFKEETEVSGIPAYKYHLDRGLIGNSTYNASNACYNPHPDLMVDLPSDYLTGEPMQYRPYQGELAGPLPDGLLNVSSCKFNAPSYVSLPHFYQADPALLDQFHPDSDLAPTETQHSSYLTMMPKEGIPLEVAIRLQINVLYRPFVGCPVEMFADVEPTFYPAIWFETATTLPDDLASDMKMLKIVPYLGTYIGMFSLGMGVSLAVLGPLIIFIMRKMRQVVLSV